MVVTVADAEALVAVQAASYARASKVLRGAWPQERSLAAGAMRAFLDARSYGVLATARPDGRPQAAPLSFFVRGGAFWFATVPGPRLRNLRASPYATFVITTGEDDAHRVVMAEGVVNVHEPSAALRAEWAARHGSHPTWAAAMLELVPERLFSNGPTGDSPPPIAVTQP
jgi:nitroimidazol reductase NimA-like FMN-containing flavoprotein (pyridoxamine 5'-phosphate oxidase superfamily)